METDGPARRAFRNISKNHIYCLDNRKNRLYYIYKLLRAKYIQAMNEKKVFL